MNTKHAKFLFSALTVAFALSPVNANAIQLSATTGGTFTFNYDSAALGQAAFGTNFNNNGYYLSNFWNSADSDPSNAAYTKNYFTGSAGTTEIPATNLVHDITATGTNLANQPLGRNVQATTTGFTIESTDLSGVVNEKMGLTGVQRFYAQNYSGGAYVTAGDMALQYDPSVSSGTGWYIRNYFAFGLNLYDLSNLSLTVTDANNWQLSGDMLLTAGYAGMIFGQTGANVGTFNLGVGSYAAPVPVPAAAWLFGPALAGLFGFGRRKIAK